MTDLGRALVLGGGGVTGIGWETGLLAGLAENGLLLSEADVVVGTSAGAVVGAQLRSGRPIEQLYERQLEDASGEIAARMSPLTLLRFVALSAWPGDEVRARVRTGRAALRATTVPEGERLRVIQARLPSSEWPAARLLLTAVDAVSGELMVFDNQSAVDLSHAVAASCAVPLVWPPMTIGNRRYIDGGVRSVTNVDLAKGCSRVVVLAPITASLRRSASIGRQLAGLGPGVRSVVLSPDAESRRAIGNNVLDPARRAGSAQAGRRQAATVVEAVRSVWTEVSHS